MKLTAKMTKDDYVKLVQDYPYEVRKFHGDKHIMINDSPSLLAERIDSLCKKYNGKQYYYDLVMAHINKLDNPSSSDGRSRNR